MRRGVILLAALCALLILTAPALAATIQGDDATQFQAWANESQVPVYQGTITMVSQVGAASMACGNTWALGCTQVGYDGSVTVWVDPLASLPEERQLFYHELGQVFGGTLSILQPAVSDQMRAAFDAIWNWQQPISNWTVASPTRGGPPFEWFAEGYRLCADGASTEAQVNAINQVYASSMFAYPGSDAGGQHLTPNSWTGESRTRARWAMRRQLDVCALIRQVADAQTVPALGLASRRASEYSSS